MSNALLDTPWPKVERGKSALRKLLDGDEKLSPDDIFPILADDAPAEDCNLPDTGVGIEFERMLSAPFIRTKEYGTRCSTVLLVESDGRVTFVERRFGTDDGVHEDSEFEFRVGS